jgi:hypothetical protein
MYEKVDSLLEFFISQNIWTAIKCFQTFVMPTKAFLIYHFCRHSKIFEPILQLLF